MYTFIDKDELLTNLIKAGVIIEKENGYVWVSAKDPLNEIILTEEELSFRLNQHMIMLHSTVVADNDCTY